MYESRKKRHSVPSINVLIPVCHKFKQQIHHDTLLQRIRGAGKLEGVFTTCRSPIQTWLGWPSWKVATMAWGAVGYERLIGVATNVYQNIFQQLRSFTRGKSSPKNGFFLPQIYLCCKKKNTFQFHSPLKVNGCILYGGHSVPWYLTVTLCANSLLPALLPWQSICHAVPSIQEPPRTRFHRCLGRCLTSPARKSPSTVTNPGHGVISEVCLEKRAVCYSSL